MTFKISSYVYMKAVKKGYFVQETLLYITFDYIKIYHAVFLTFQLYYELAYYMYTL